MGPFEDDENDDNAGKIGVNNEGELTVGLGSGLGIDAEGDLNLEVAPGFSVEL